MKSVYRVHTRLETALSQRKNTGYIVAEATHEDKDGLHFRYLEFPSFQKFKEHSQTLSQKRFHEVLKSQIELSSGGYQSGIGRLAFDLDLKTKLYGHDFLHPNFDRDFEAAIKRTLSKYYLNVDTTRLEFVWMTCSRPEKYSRHLIVKNAVLGDFRHHLKLFYELLLHEIREDSNFYYIPMDQLKFSSGLIDTNLIHGPFLRMAGSEKAGHQLRLDSDRWSLEDTLVRPFGIVDMSQEQQITQLSELGLQTLGELEKRKPTVQSDGKDLNSLTEDQIIELVRLLSEERATNTRKWLNVGRCLKQLSDTEKVFQAWVSWSRIPPKYSHLTEKFYRGWWDKFDKWIWTSKHLLSWVKSDSYEDFSNFMQANPQIKLEWKYRPTGYEPPRHWRVIIDRYEDEKIKPLDPRKVIEVIRSKMDTQKSRTMYQYIKEHPDSGQILIPTSREKFALYASEDFRREFPERKIYLYTDIKNWGEVDPNGIIIVQMESLGKLIEKRKIQVPGILFLDEATACLAQMSSPTMDRHLEYVKPALEGILRVAKKIVAMDADIDERIIDLLLELRNEPIYLQWNSQKYTGRRMRYIKDVNRQKEHLLERLKLLGENIFVIATSNNEAHRLRDLVDEHGISVRCHTSTEAVQDREDLRDVNALWVKYQCVIITSTITNGVNFHVEHFDSMFVFGDCRCGPVRDLKQMMGRVRKLRTGYIFSNVVSYKYKFPTSYEAIKKSIINRKIQYVETLDRLVDDESPLDERMKTQVAEISMKLDSRMAVVGEDGLLTFAYRPDGWLGHLHIQNIRERNRSRNHYFEEFIYAMTEQGIPIEYVTEQPKSARAIKEMVTEISRALNEKEQLEYEQTPVVDPQEAARIKERIEARVEEEGDRIKYEVYSTCKYFQEKPSFEHHRFFQKNKEQCVNAKLELEDKLETVIASDKMLSQHVHHIRGRIDKYLLVKEFCRRLNIANTVTEFTLSTEIFKTDQQDWFKFGNKIQQSFELGTREIRSVQRLVNVLRGMLREWSRTNLSDGQQQKKKKQGRETKYTTYQAKPSVKMKEILSLMRPIEQTGAISLFDIGDGSQLVEGQEIVL